MSVASSGMDSYPPEAGDMFREMRNTVPLGRFGLEAEVSAAIVFLLCPAASFISGSTLRVDGARPQARMGWPMTLPSAEAQQRSSAMQCILLTAFRWPPHPKCFSLEND